MITDLPKYKSKFEAKGYICEKGLTEGLKFSKIDNLKNKFNCFLTKSLIYVNFLI